MQRSVREGGDDGPLSLLLRAVLQGVQVCAVGDLREQGRVPLLQGQDDGATQEEAQVSMIIIVFFLSCLCAVLI